MHPIEKIMKDRELSRAEFASIIGVTSSHISLIITGGRSVSPKVGAKIDAAFGAPRVVTNSKRWLDKKNAKLAERFL